MRILEIAKGKHNMGKRIKPRGTGMILSELAGI